MTDLFVFPDIAGNEINLSSSENYKNHATADHSCVDAIISQFNSEFYYYLKEQEELNLIDLGANIGLFSIFVAPVCEKVFAVEPTPSHFSLLEEIVEVSGKKNIVPSQLAIGTSDGEAEFNIHERNSTMNSFLDCPVDPHSGKTVKVKTQTLNSFIDSLDVDRVGFVKMDIEGFENEIIFEPSFEDAMTKIDGLYVEVHDFAGLGPVRGMEVNFNKIADKMRAWGRSVEKLQADCMLVY
jgi:FkbM family methyltransferase|tara:strand:+ start:79 stop:795 length:717 start_codon:yes stop_codon:yes gene_type:complete